ncbi:very short patch repair endonuclease [Streptomyces sp. ISL-10]|uniref:very short patch repair endonuclease n=1 Tax=Streptomyces sp. ISL-10 TaxID=2819172 RepID=UPI001BEB883A|nr:very short patch repair endonuclease [Streptomyces sp. ISL-10]MBT2365399.1 very short patch repair endonuclease [Streptomyces sp. ISL-10]
MTQSSQSWASTPAVRASMRANRSRDTGPELLLRRALHARGYRYRVASRPLPELRRTADLVFSRAKVAVFVDGCFWHGCPIHHRLAKRNRDYWEEKIRKNRIRDEEVDEKLAAAGWLSIRIWEHENVASATSRVSEAVDSRRYPGLTSPQS